MTTTAQPAAVTLELAGRTLSVVLNALLTYQAELGKVKKKADLLGLDTDDIETQLETTEGLLTELGWSKPAKKAKADDEDDSGELFDEPT